MNYTETLLSFLITKLWLLRLCSYIVLPSSPKHITLLCLVFLFMLETMVDFPPNLEDGELWLPSDVLHEIASTNIEPETSSHQGFIHNAAYDHVGQVAIHPKNSAPRYLPDLVPNYEVFPFFLSLIRLFFSHNRTYD